MEFFHANNPAVNANSSRNSILGFSLSIKCSGYCANNHSLLNTAPIPSLFPNDASEVNVRICDDTLWPEKSTKGLQSWWASVFSKKIFHSLQSSRKSLSKLTWWCCLSKSPFLFLSFSLLYIPFVNALPGTITLLRKFNVPVSFCTNLIVAFFALNALWIKSNAFFLFYKWTPNVLELPFNKTPKNVIMEDPHSVFSSKIGQLMWAQIMRNSLTIPLHVLMQSAMNRKSSR